MKTKSVFLLTVLLCVFGLSACQATDNEPHEVIVFAASSLTDSFMELADAFEADHPNVEVVLNFGSSSQLAAQLSEGAVADVYASANEKQMQVVIDAERIDTSQLFASNRLVIIVPDDNPANVKDLSDLALPGLQLVTAVSGVPVRQYTDDMLTTLAADPNYGTDYQQAVYNNVVSEEDNVRLVATKVALGEADAAVVYKTDVTPDIASDVQQIDVPDEYNVLAAYPIGLINDAPEPELGQAFIDFVLEEQGQAILEKWGFGPAPTR